MKLLTTLAALVAISLASCAGIEARDTVLLPAMRTAYVSIEQNIADGVAEESAAIQAMVKGKAADLRVALKGNSLVAIAAVDWHSLRGWAEKGVKDRNLSPPIQHLLLLRIEWFHESYVKLVAP